MAKKQARHCRHWTAEEDATLRKLWGSGKRTLQKALHRSVHALRWRAGVLGLERQTHGLKTRNEVCRFLGIEPLALLILLRDCGVEEAPFCPLQDPRTRSGVVWKAHDADLLRQLLLLRENITTLPSVWAQSRGERGPRGRALLTKHGLYKKSPDRRFYVPKGVFEELSSDSPGVWCKLWGTLLTWDRPTRVAPWFLAIMAHTLLLGRAGTWVEDYERPQVEAEARELLRACGLGTSHERSARGTSPSTEP